MSPLGGGVHLFTVSCWHTVFECGALNLNTAVRMFVLNPLTTVDPGIGLWCIR